MTWIYLTVAILAEVAATSALKMSEGFSRPIASLVTVVGYLIAFYLLALTLRVMPVGVAYAVWSGAGIVAISLIGYFFFRQSLDLAALIGIGLILAGVIVLNVLSKTAGH